MEQTTVKHQPNEPTINAIFAAELFSKLSEQAQDQIIDLLKSLLSD